LVKRIKDCSKDGPGSFPRRNNLRNSKIGWDHFKIFSRTTELILRGHIYIKTF
jgi:hypothetical protein